MEMTLDWMRSSLRLKSTILSKLWALMNEQLWKILNTWILSKLTNSKNLEHSRKFLSKSLEMWCLKRSMSSRKNQSTSGRRRSRNQGMEQKNPRNNSNWHRRLEIHSKMTKRIFLTSRMRETLRVKTTGLIRTEEYKIVFLRENPETKSKVHMNMMRKSLLSQMGWLIVKKDWMESREVMSLIITHLENSLVKTPWLSSWEI